jgi:hypothetical protein
MSLKLRIPKGAYLAALAGEFFFNLHSCAMQVSFSFI